MLSKAEFIEQLTDAYDHLYDLVYLRTHPLTGILIPDAGLHRKEKAWQLHHVLLDVINELDPGPQAPVFSREWRRHRLMILRYEDGLDPQSVANELAISRRHYYREHEAAINAIASVLWNRYTTRPAASDQVAATAVERQEAPSRLEMLRLEAARVTQPRHYACIDDVIQGVLSLLQDMLRQHNLDISLAIPESPPGVSVDRILLRQILLGIMGYLTERTESATIRLTTQFEASTVYLSLTMDPPTSFHPASREEMEERLSAFEEMAALSCVQILPIKAGCSIIGFEIQLPTIPRRTVLVVDDNEDVLELFQRYLLSNGYSVVTAQTAHDALALARRLEPHAITVDLMMPDQDGWDLLQTLLNQSETSHIPIIVCSVLKQKDLALSLGASFFLEKPFTERTLLSALEALEQDAETEDHP